MTPTMYFATGSSSGGGSTHLAQRGGGLGFGFGFGFGFWGGREGLEGFEEVVGGWDEAEAGAGAGVMRQACQWRAMAEQSTLTMYSRELR